MRPRYPFAKPLAASLKQKCSFPCCLQWCRIVSDAFPSLLHHFYAWLAWACCFDSIISYRYYYLLLLRYVPNVAKRSI